ncbi:MAG: ribosome silencing factor [Bacteroidetes bacterium GWA2_30_7]|nr:MAG: ribosome silencing factor [Bacteroidetes bacterium GWA2_30_7]
MRNIDETEKLFETIIESIREKQGKDIISLDMTKLQNSITKYFIICHADSTTHVSTIAEYIEINAKKKLNERVWKTEGWENSQWILLDYSNVVVHVFLNEYRKYYNLEALWADSVVFSHSSDN